MTRAPGGRAADGRCLVRVVPTDEGSDDCAAYLSIDFLFEATRPSMTIWVGPVAKPCAS
jgi:hypothetical protein